MHGEGGAGGRGGQSCSKDGWKSVSLRNGIMMRGDPGCGDSGDDRGVDDDGGGAQTEPCMVPCRTPCKSMTIPTK